MFGFKTSAGHRELGTTQRYRHLRPAALDAAIQLLDGRDNVESRENRVAKVGSGTRDARKSQEKCGITGGEAGIRTLGRAFRPYNGLANRRLQPPGHLTVDV